MERLKFNFTNLLLKLFGKTKWQTRLIFTLFRWIHQKLKAHFSGIWLTFAKWYHFTSIYIGHNIGRIFSILHLQPYKHHLVLNVNDFLKMKEFFVNLLNRFYLADCTLTWRIVFCVVRRSMDHKVLFLRHLATMSETLSFRLNLDLARQFQLQFWIICGRIFLVLLAQNDENCVWGIFACFQVNLRAHHIT